MVKHSITLLRVLGNLVILLSLSLLNIVIPPTVEAQAVDINIGAAVPDSCSSSPLTVNFNASLAPSTTNSTQSLKVELSLSKAPRLGETAELICWITAHGRE